MLHCVGGARFSNHLNVYRRQHIDPHNLGFAQATQLSTTHHLRDLSCQRDGQVRCEEEQKQCTKRGRGHSLFQRHERAVHGKIRCWLKMGRRSVVSSVRRRWRDRQWCLNGRRIIPADLCRTQTQSCFLKGCHVHHGGWSKEALAHRINDVSMHERREFKKPRMSALACAKGKNAKESLTCKFRAPGSVARTADDHHAILLLRWN